MKRHLLAMLTVACAGAQLSGQGYLRWPDASQKLDGMLVRTAIDEYRLCFPGWTTISDNAEGGEGEAAGLGVPSNGVVRKVSATEVAEEESGDTLDMPIFPFRFNTNTTSAFVGMQPTFQWWGFFADVTQSVPAFERAALCFKIESAATLPTLLTELRNSVVIVAEANSDGTLTGARQTLLVNPKVILGRILYYKFDRGDSGVAFNYATYGAVRRVGQVVTNDVSGWSSGRFGTALRGGNIAAPPGRQTYCDTGWDGGLFGDFTVSWFMRERNDPGAQVSHLFSGPGGFRCFTNGTAGSGLRCDNWGGAPLTFGHDVQAAAKSGWVHVALVVSSAAAAVWYVNGNAQQNSPISAHASVPPGGNSLRIGASPVPASAGTYDIDEFRLSAFAASPAQVMAWATGPDAAATSMGTTCGCNLRHAGGLPVMASTQYGLRTEGPPGSPYAVIFGVATRLGGVPMPLDMGAFVPSLAGCQLYTDFALTIPGVTDAGGLGHLPVSIPILPVRSPLYSQVAMLGAGAGLLLCNAHVSSIE